MGREAFAPLAMCAAIGIFLGVGKLQDLHQQGWPWWALITGVLLAASAGAGLGWWMWRTVRHTSAKQKLTDVRALDDYTGKGAAEKGRGLRSSLTDTKNVEMHELAARMGRVGRTTLWKSWEDVCLVFMGPRSNKTSAIAVPTVLSAPGAVVATSNKPDLWMLTAGLRSRVGRVFTFDPFAIAYVPQTWWWNPLADVDEPEDAQKLAGHFVSTVDAGNNRDIWGPAAKSLLGQLFLAAAVSGRCLRDSLNWLYTGSDEPIGILERSGHLLEAAKLATTLEGAAETRSGFVLTASEAVSCLTSEKVLRWVTPPSTWRTPPKAGEKIEELDLWQFVTPREDGQYPTLYLLTQEGAGTAGPVVAALVDRLFRISKQAASAMGGRLDPVLTAMLDEAANICRIADLPAYYSWFGSVGVSVTTLLQSYAQGEGVWGKTGMETLYSASTLNIVGAGTKDVHFARTLSTSIGEHLVKRNTDSYGPGGSSRSVAQVREPIMPVDEIINLVRTKAIWHVTGHRPVLMKLLPWYRENDRDEISSTNADALEQVRIAAVEALGSANPVARHLSDAIPVNAAEVEKAL